MATHARGDNDYAPVFLPWSARPDRTPAWYAQQRRDVFARTGSYDDCDQEYPATDTEALQGRSLDKRFPAPWLDACKAVRNPLVDSFMSIPGLAVYALPDQDCAYVIGADPAEGNPQSDESAACVLDVGPPHIWVQPCPACGAVFDYCLPAHDYEPPAYSDGPWLTGEFDPLLQLAARPGQRGTVT